MNHLAPYSSIKLPHFPSEEDLLLLEKDNSLNNGVWSLKKYLSIYLNLDQRKNFIQTCINSIDFAYVCYQTTITHISENRSSFLLYLQNNISLKEISIHTK